MIKGDDEEMQLFIFSGFFVGLFGKTESRISVETKLGIMLLGNYDTWLHTCYVVHVDFNGQDKCTLISLGFLNRSC